MEQPAVHERQTGAWRQPVGWLAAAVLVIVVAYYGARALLADTNSPVHLVVYGFSTQEQVYTQGIFPSFEQAWEAETGRELTIEGVFGASGTLAGQINLGAPADVVVFSNAEHVDWLKVGRRVRQDAEPVIVGCSPMIIASRPGVRPALAPIQGYADLAQTGLSLIHADPRSSGAGQWAVLAEYGSALLTAGDPVSAETQLRAIWRNVRLLADSARAAMTLFELGAADALVTYEQDALLAQDRGVELVIVNPARTIVAEHAGQQILSQFHGRPPDCKSDFLPALVEPFTVEDLGGWSQAYTELVETLWQGEIEPRLDLEPSPRLLSTGEQR
jgi:ABC-type sulfate transport system substrate-binding protein